MSSNGLLGQHNKDLSSTDTDALLDKIRTMLRQEEDMYGNERQAEAALRVEL
jgi:hypothetical protein